MKLRNKIGAGLSAVVFLSVLLIPLIFDAQASSIDDFTFSDTTYKSEAVLRGLDDGNKAIKGEIEMVERQLKTLRAYAHAQQSTTCKQRELLAFYKRNDLEAAYPEEVPEWAVVEIERLKSVEMDSMLCGTDFQ